MTTPRANAIPIALAIVGAAALTAAWMFGPAIVRSAYAGHSFAVFNQALAGRSTHSLDDYLGFLRQVLLACTAAFVAATALAAALIWLTRRVPRDLSAGVAAGLLILVAAGVAIDRRQFAGEALERDLTVYMTIAAGLVDGKTLYVDLWDHKPPAIHATYAAAAEVFGATPTAIWVLGVVAAWLTLWGCYVAGRSVGGRFGGIAAALVWALVNRDLLLQANQPNVEVFMNACLVWAFALMLKPEDGARVGRYAAVGALFFLGSLYKPVVAVTACAVVAAGAVLSLLPSNIVHPSIRPSVPPYFRPSVPAMTVIQNLALAAGAAGLGWIATIGYFAAAGRISPFYEAVVEYNRDYAGDVGHNLLASLFPAVDALSPLLPYVPLGMLAGVVAVVALFTKHRRPWGLLLAYLVGAWAAVALPGRLYPHYLQLMLPPIAVGAGWLVAEAVKRRSPLAITACVIMLSGPLAARAYQASVPLAGLPVFKYGGYGYDIVETQRMGSWINSNYPRPAVVYHWGPDPAVYFYAGRQSPVRFSFNLPLIDGSDRALRYSNAVLAQLTAQPPDLIVVRALEFTAIDNPIETWIQERYQRIEGPPGVERYLFMVPRDRADTARRE